MAKRKYATAFDTRDRCTGLPQARLRLARGIQRVIDNHDADRECRHGHLPSDPTPTCRCFKGPVLRLVQMVEDALTLAEQLLSVALRVADRLDSTDPDLRELRDAARRLERVLRRAA